MWAFVAIGAPLTGLSVAAGTAVALSDKLEGLDQPAAEAARLTGYGHLFAGRIIAGAITRAWWPLVLPLALVSKRARRILAAAALLPPLIDWVRQRPPLDPLRYVALRILDDAAYGVGLWQGAIGRRTAEPLLPDLTSWPQPSRYDRHSAPPS